MTRFESSSAWWSGAHDDPADGAPPASPRTPASSGSVSPGTPTRPWPRSSSRSAASRTSGKVFSRPAATSSWSTRACTPAAGLWCADRGAYREPRRVSRRQGIPAAARPGPLPRPGAGHRALSGPRRARHGARQRERRQRPADGSEPAPGSRARSAHRPAPRPHAGVHGRGRRVRRRGLGPSARRSRVSRWSASPATCASSRPGSSRSRSPASWGPDGAASRRPAAPSSWRRELGPFSTRMWEPPVCSIACCSRSIALGGAQDA